MCNLLQINTVNCNENCKCCLLLLICYVLSTEGGGGQFAFQFCTQVRMANQMILTRKYRVFIKYCFFPYNVVIFLNSVSSAAALVFYLPGVCTHTDTEGKQRKANVRNILKSSENNTVFNEHPVHDTCRPFIS